MSEVRFLPSPLQGSMSVGKGCKSDVLVEYASGNGLVSSTRQTKVRFLLLPLGTVARIGRRYAHGRLGRWFDSTMRMKKGKDPNRRLCALQIVASVPLYKVQIFVGARMKVRFLLANRGLERKAVRVRERPGVGWVWQSGKTDKGRSSAWLEHR